MTADYHGDSVGKRLARVSYWLSVRAWMGRAFCSSRHLILASRVGGDISVLRALGVSDRNIIAVDSNREAAIECQERTGLQVLVGDIADVADGCGAQRIGSAFLDFCGIANESMGLTVARVAKRVMNAGCVGWAYQRGRENRKTTSAQLEATEPANQRAIHAAGDLRGWVRDRVDAKIVADSLDQRSFYVYDVAQRAASSLGVAFMTLRRLLYDSSDVHRHGVPMGIELRWIHRTKNSRRVLGDDGRLTRPVDALSKEWWGALLRESVRAGGDGASIGAWRGHRFYAPAISQIVGPFCTPQVLVAYADELQREFPGAAAQLLNMSAAELAATRAHVTRGTYDHKISKRARHVLPSALRTMRATEPVRLGDVKDAKRVSCIVGDDFLEFLDGSGAPRRIEWAWRRKV